LCAKSPAKKHNKILQVASRTASNHHKQFNYWADKLQFCLLLYRIEANLCSKKVGIGPKKTYKILSTTPLVIDWLLQYQQIIAACSLVLADKFCVIVNSIRGSASPVWCCNKSTNSRERKREKRILALALTHASRSAFALAFADSPSRTRLRGFAFALAFALRTVLRASICRLPRASLRARLGLGAHTRLGLRARKKNQLQPTTAGARNFRSKIEI